MSTAPRSEAAKRNWGNDDSETPILHVDMDSFFAQVEIQMNPVLRDRPVIVGGNGNRGVVCSATYDARARGVHAAMPVARAARLCPEAVILPSRHDLYSKVGAMVRKIFYDFTPVVEPVSIDEAFLDVSSVQRILGAPTQIAERIRGRIRNELGLTASIGIAANKLVAKTASANAKPDGMLLVPACASVAFMHALPVGALWGVGAKTRERLDFAGINTIGELAETPVDILRGWFGQSAAQRLHDLAWARDSRNVEVGRVDKSFSKEVTFDKDVTDRPTLEVALLRQAHAVATRLRERGLLAYTVGIKLRGADFQTISRARTLTVGTDLARVISEQSRQLLASLSLPRGGVRLIGVRVSNLVEASAGIQIAFDDDLRNVLSERAIDNVKRRFGDTSIMPATLIQDDYNQPD